MARNCNLFCSAISSWRARRHPRLRRCVGDPPQSPPSVATDGLEISRGHTARHHAMVVCMPTVSLWWAAVTAVPHTAWRLLGAPSSAARRHAMVVCMPTVSLRWVAVTAPPLPHTAWRLLGAPIQRARSRVLCCPARHHVAQCCAHSPGIVPPRTAGIVLLHTIWLADVLTSPHTVLPSPTMSRCGALCTARRCPASAHSRRTAGGVPSVSPHRAAACVSAGSRLACELCGSSSTLTHSLMHPLLRRGRQRTVVVRPVVSPPCHHTAPQHASVPARVLPVNYAARRPP